MSRVRTAPGPSFFRLFFCFPRLLAEECFQQSTLVIFSEVFSPSPSSEGSGKEPDLLRHLHRLLLLLCERRTGRYAAAAARVLVKHRGFTQPRAVGCLLPPPPLPQHAHKAGNQRNIHRPGREATGREIASCHVRATPLLAPEDAFTGGSPTRLQHRKGGALGDQQRKPISLLTRRLMLRFWCLTLLPAPLPLLTPARACAPAPDHPKQFAPFRLSPPLS